VCVRIYIYVCMHVYLCLYLYLSLEREREAIFSECFRLKQVSAEGYLIYVQRLFCECLRGIFFRWGAVSRRRARSATMDAVAKRRCEINAKLDVFHRWLTRCGSHRSLREAGSGIQSKRLILRLHSGIVTPYIYIHIYREREREMCIYLYLYLYVCMSIYMFISGASGRGFGLTRRRPWTPSLHGDAKSTPSWTGFIGG